VRIKISWHSVDSHGSSAWEAAHSVKIVYPGGEGH
jgi:hypothetical protein